MTRRPKRILATTVEDAEEPSAAALGSLGSDHDRHAEPFEPVEDFPEALEGVPEPIEDAPAHPKEPKQRRGLAWLFGIAVLILGATFVLERQEPSDTTKAPAKAQGAPVPVTVTDVTTSDVPIYLDGLGTVQASNTIAIHSQVDGKLQSVNFVEGQNVHKGDTLAVIDPRPFNAVLDQAKAKKAQDEAQLVSDQKDFTRFKDLVGKGAGTQQGRRPSCIRRPMGKKIQASSE